eukprot:symbB.v1.2.026273.t1/scaffold2600.1/size76924/4
MKPSLGESATVVSASNVSAEVVCPSVSNRSQTWNLKCLQPDPSEALYCLDIHDHPLLWCGSFPNCHTCDADCDRRRIWEAYRCAKCDFDVCSECSKHHLGALGTALLPRGLKSSRHSCMGELLPGGCRCSDGDSPAAGACCAFGNELICPIRDLLDYVDGIGATVLGTDVHAGTTDSTRPWQALKQGGACVGVFASKSALFHGLRSWMVCVKSWLPSKRSLAWWNRSGLLWMKRTSNGGLEDLQITQLPTSTISRVRPRTTLPDHWR